MSRSIAVAYSLKKKKNKQKNKEVNLDNEYELENEQKNKRVEKEKSDDKKKMASGGTVESGDETMNYADGGGVQAPCSNCASAACKGCGGVVGSAMKKYSKGGRVANEKGDGVDSLPNEFDDLALRDGLEFSYDGANSGDELGGPDKDDVVARAMLKRKKK